MTDTPEMPAMVPPAIYRAAGIRETTRAINEIDAAYRDGFTAGVLAERSPPPVDVDGRTIEQRAWSIVHNYAPHWHNMYVRKYPNSKVSEVTKRDECAHYCVVEALKSITPVDAAAIRRAAFEEAAQSLRARAVGWRRQRPGLGPIERSHVADCLEALAAALLLDPAAGWVGRDCPLSPEVKCNWKSCRDGACFLQNAADHPPAQPGE